MTPERWRQIEDLYHSARDRGPQVLSGADPDLRREVEELLAQDSGANILNGNILDRPAAELLDEIPPATAEGRGLIGQTVSHYRILDILGVGGMGEVYRARDTKLKRDVAIKVLPESFAGDPSSVARFQREAEVLASLNHPNIAHIYGVEGRALVMEIVEGKSPKGPMPFEAAWKIALQIADALEDAHEKGIIHRDLKPANVKVTPSGVVKLLDFGLAKVFDELRPSAGEGRDSITATFAPTATGAIMGTPAYMSPEQATGKKVDKRTDIWAWGVVLYELLTGERLFKGDSAADTLAQVLTAESDLGRVPPNVRQLLSACLEKDPKRRLRDIGDARRFLETTETAAGAPQRRGAVVAATAVAAIAMAALAALAFMHPREAPSEANAVNLSVKLPPDSAPAFLALSPDGSRLVATGVGGPGLYLRSLDSSEFRPLPGTDGARVPFWSPDSRRIGFFADGKLKTIPITGGPATVLCDQVGLGLGGTWNRAGVILFSSGVLAAGPYGEGFLRRVNASGGACTAVIPGGQGTTNESDNSNDASDTTGSIPAFLPDGNHFLYASSGALYVASLDGTKRRKVLNDNSNALYAPPASGHGPGFVLFLRDASLMAQPFDTDKLATTGEPFALASPLAQSNTRPQMLASLADNGTLAWVAHQNRLKQLKWFDRTGKDLGNASQPGDYTGIALSPDGNNAVVGGTGQVTGGIWLFDFVRKSQSRLTGGERGAASGVWSPTGDRVVYASHRTLVLRDLNAASGREAGGEAKDVPLLPRNSNGRAPSDWSRDGHYLIYSQNDPKTGADIWYLPDPGKPGSTPVKFLGSDAIESQGQLSPDGHWLAYYSNEPPNKGISIRPFPSGAGVWRVAANAIEPRWSRDGKELFCRTLGEGGWNTLMAISIQVAADGQLRFGDPHKLFSFVALNSFPQINAFGYAPAPDGKRFLVGVGAEGEKPELNIILNWQKLIPEIR